MTSQMIHGVEEQAPTIGPAHADVKLAESWLSQAIDSRDTVLARRGSLPAPCMIASTNACDPSRTEAPSAGRWRAEAWNGRGGVMAQPGMSPTERSLRARMAAYRLHSRYDGRELTSNARAAFNDRFAREVDPEKRLPEGERLRRAECARKAYFAALAAKSVRSRRLAAARERR